MIVNNYKYSIILKSHHKNLGNYIKLQALTEKGNMSLVKKCEMYDFAKGE